MNGGAGNDALESAFDGDEDIYVFDAASGHDLIYAWEDGVDLIDLVSFGLGAISPATLTIAVSGVDYVITINGIPDFSITLRGSFVAGDTIDQSDFIIS